MKVLGLTLDSSSSSPILLLQEADGSEILPLWIGAMEAMAISLSLSGINVRRPLTHDLMLLTLQALKASLFGVEITDLREGTYLADLLLIKEDVLYRIDCRPSDAIALALRADAPISVSREVLRMAKEMHKFSTEDESDAATSMVRGAADKLIQEKEHTINPATDYSEITDAEERDQKLFDLLKNMEPVSKRRM